MILGPVGALPQPSSNCQRKCGEIDVPYPFGIGPYDSPDHCAMPGFNLSCDGNRGLRLLNPDLVVLNISLLQGQARMLNPISSACYNNSTNPRAERSNGWHMNLTDTPYRFSDAHNMFTVIGCRTLAYIQAGDTTGYMSGCVAMCRRSDVKTMREGSCFGIGCCQTAIPKGMAYYSVYFDGNFNATDIKDVSACSYAVLMDSSNFTFRTSYTTSPEFYSAYGGRAPLVVDWAIGNETCEEAYKKPESYACVSSNSNCFDSFSGRGYICNCSKGFEGNPYLSNGCQDIDECMDQKKYPCYGTCHNTAGGFDCFCPPAIAIGLSVAAGSLLLSLSGLFLIRKWRRHAQRQTQRKYFRKNKGLLLEQLILSDQIASDNTKIFSFEELQKATNNFDPTRMLGSGGHGMVYKGILSDQRVVAIKKSKVIKEDEINQFINEVAILSQINHRNIVKLFGCCLETEVPLLVYDFIPNGSLFETIHGDPSKEYTLSWDDCLRIATEAAGALCYLHSAATISIFHRDVKSSNILLDANYIAKVSDFGASRLIPTDQTHVVTNVQGTYGYLDPEYYHTGKLNEKSDVYSFGVVLLELLLRKKPIFICESGLKTNLSNHFLEVIKGRPITDIVAAQVLGEASESEINSVAALAESCLRIRGEERPTMKQVEMTLQSLRIERLSSCPAPPRDDEKIEIPPVLSTRPVENLQPLNIGLRSSDNNLASSACYKLQGEFISSANLAR
ncbi:Wall-associated receptor kinase 2 [Dichanthelium oligosanthes]|uniref:Wall-associated receptor kinase 2 n=1 Tax=Dichanthelium oligosanthes TaxID=888268 RepID=A0A1E5WIK5_9POAL|nr:Wall-associated receptor kinase 2 [Dichanthelium oligosanthes]